MEDSSGLWHETNCQIADLVSVFLLRKNDKTSNACESSCCSLKFLVESSRLLLEIKCKSSTFQTNIFLSTLLKMIIWHISFPLNGLDYCVKPIYFAFFSVCVSSHHRSIVARAVNYTKAK